MCVLEYTWGIVNIKRVQTWTDHTVGREVGTWIMMIRTYERQCQCLVRATTIDDDYNIWRQCQCHMRRRTTIDVKDTKDWSCGCTEIWTRIVSIVLRPPQVCLTYTVQWCILRCHSREALLIEWRMVCRKFALYIVSEFFLQIQDWCIPPQKPPQISS